MAEIVVPGPVSGRRYGFVISGDTPTVDEQLRIDASIRQQEGQFADEFETRRGVRPAGAEAGFLDYLGEFPKGVARGGVNIVESGALGLASLLPEDYEDPTREFIRRTAYGLRPQVDIGLEDTVSGKFGEALGSFVGLGATTFLPGGQFIAPGLAVSAGAGEASERARAAGATPEERAQALLPGAAVGALELIPIKFMKALGRDETLSVSRRLARIAESAGVEGAQEAASEIAQNLIAQGIYNPEQGAFEGTGESLGYGAGVGGLVQGLLDLAVPGRRRAAPPEAPPEEAPAAPPAPQEAQDVAPVALPDPAEPITLATLDELGVPKGAPVYKQFPDITDRDAQIAALEDFAGVTKDRRVEANIRTYVEQARAADLAARAPALSGIGAGGAGAGVRGAGEPGAVPTAGTGAPDTGRLAVPRESAGAARGAEDVRAAALTEEEAFELAAKEAEADRPAAVEDTTGLASMGSGIAQAMRENYIDMLFRRFQEGKTTDAAGSTSPALKVARAIQGRGVTVDRATLQNIAADADKAMELPADRRTAAMNALVDRYAPRADEARAAAQPPNVEVQGADWLKENVAFNRELADRRGITAKIEELFAQGLTAAQVQAQLDRDGDLQGIPVEDKPGFVVGVRASLGIPSRMSEEGKTEFQEWLSEYRQRVQPTPEEEPIPGFDEMPDEAAPKAQKDITPEEIESRAAAAPEPEIEPEDVVAVMRYDALSEQQKNDLAEAAGIPRAGNQLVVAIIDDPAGFMRLMDRLAEAGVAPTPEGLTTAEMAPAYRNAIPGRTTGAAGQVIPEGITPVPGREPELRPTTEGEAEINEAVNAARARKAQRERTADTNAAAEIRRKFAENSPELQEFTREEVVADPDKDITSAEDKQAVLALLDKKFTKREKTSTNPEWAAHEYFRKHADMMTALDTIAYDAIAAPTKFAKITDDMSPGAKEYYSNTGRRWGTTAGKWVLDNLSRDARLAIFERLDFYRPETNTAMQRAVAADRDKMVERGRTYREYMGDQTGDYVGVAPDTETAQELGFGTEDLGDIEALFSPTAALDMPMHPQVVRAFMRGDINAALDGIIATAGSPEAAKLAAKLRPFVQNVTLRSFSPEQMANINAVLGDGRRTSKAGVYISRYNEADLQAAETYAPERVALRRELGGSVILNSQTGFTPSTLLHELIHVATTATLDNKAHPLTKQVETLLAKAREIIPAYENGLLNRYEFVSEAMTNPAFIQRLAQIDIGLGKEKFTLRQRIMHSIANFVRQLLGRPQKKLGTAKTEIDQMFDDLLAPEPSQRGVGSLYEAAFRPDGYRDAMNSMKDRVVEATPKDMQGVRRLARSTFRAIPYGAQAKEFTVRASAPLMFVAETAQRYMPSAYQVYETVMAHGSQQHRMSQRVDETILEIQDWIKKNREKVPLFDRVRFRATELRMDPRKPRSEYDQFQLTYDVLDANGDFVERKTLSFPTREARAAVYKRLRDNPKPTRSAPKNSYDPETEDNKARLDAFAQLQAEFRQLRPEGQAAVARAFDLPEYFRNEMKRVVQKRLDNMFEGQRTMQERIYKNVFEKIFAETLIDPYQALQRRGNFGLSYAARDPDTQERDPNTGAIIPGTGELKVFKHAFESTQARDQAIRLLERLGPEAEVTQITPYSMDAPGQQQVRPSLEFVTAVLNRIQERGQLARKDLEKEFLDLVFEATPESSFFRAYQQRRDVPGYEGDVTPLGQQLGPGDTINNIRRNGMHLAAKVADTEYQVDLDRLRSELGKELATFEQSISSTDPIERAANNEEANMYYGILTDFTRAPFRERANWSRTLTAGGYALTLGFNISTAAMTFFQMPTIIYPYLAGKYGPRMSMQSIGIAMRLLTSSGRERTIERVAPGGELEQVRRKVGWYDFSISNLDFTDPKNAYLKDLSEVAEIAGVFNRSLTQDILDETGAKGWVQKTAAYSGLMQHHTERLMREATLTSTYLMELHKALPQARNMPFKSFVKALRDGRISVPTEIGQQAARDAVYTSDMTNGSVLAAAAPIVSQTDLGSVIYLFKRFPLSMLNMLWHTLNRATDGSNDPVDRRIAAMQFAGISGSIAMFAGVSGIPMFHTVAALYDLLLKDDEGEDFETMIRTSVLGERGLTGLVDYYTGLSVSSRIGLSGVFYRPGFNTENQTALATLLEGFGGPVIGLFNKYSERVPYFFTEGEYWRMTEALMPTSMGNAMKGIRFYTEGARTLRYDPILDEVGPFSALAQGLGFMPTEYARQLAQNNYYRKLDNRISERRTKLLSRRYKAYRMGDTDELRRVMRDIAQYNRDNPQYPITPETLEDSLRSHRDTTSRMHHGVTFSRKNEPMFLRDAEDWGNATAFAR